MLEMEMTDLRKLLIEARKMLDHFLGDDSCMCQACLLCRSIDAALSEKVEPVPVGPECVKYLAQYEQADEDGIIVKVSRQAIHETLAHIDSLQSALQRAQEERDEAKAEAVRANEYGDRAVREICALAAVLHWPECWDTAAYPDLDSCMKEIFICNTCRNGVA